MNETGGEEIKQPDPEQLTGEFRNLAGSKNFDVNATGDRLGMLTHPNKEIANQLREFIPSVLEELMNLEDKVHGASRLPNMLNTPEHQGTESDSAKALKRFHKLVTSFARIAYHPQTDSEDVSDNTIVQEGISPRASNQIGLEDDWHIKTFGHKYTIETGILEYPQHGLRPKYLSPAGYDFDSSAIVRVKLNDGTDNLYIDVFPARYAPYPPKYSYANGTAPDVARNVLTEQRVNPQTIKTLIDQAEARAVEPHISIRLEGPLGRPITQARGNLAVRKSQDREHLGFELHIKDSGEDETKIDPIVKAMESQSVFLPLPSMKKDTNVPLASLSKAILGLGVKKVYEVRPASSTPLGKR